MKKFTFFCINSLHLVRGFQKGITLGVLGHISGFGWGWVWLGEGFWAHDPKCYTFLESSHQMQAIYAEKSKFFINWKKFFFQIYYINCKI